jgi:hypothetical protein
MSRPGERISDVTDGEPDDHTTLTSVVEGYRRAGVTADFFAGDDGTVTCGSCTSTVDASQMSVFSRRRLEGASDPADMMTVVVSRCPACGAEGTMVLGFGPMASAVDGEVSQRLQDRRGDDSLPPDAAPDEMPDTVDPG